MTDWTVYPVTHGYIPEYEQGVFDTPHYAIDIATPEDTPLTAILSGIVEKADYQPWGGEIFIKPDDSHYSTYYMYHTDLNEVSAGQHVAAGQEIALSGGQTSGGRHPVTDGESTGPHVHLGWFTRYITPSQTGYTIPYGPDPTDLLTLAEGVASAQERASTTTVSTTGRSTGCTPPSGINANNPAAWLLYWACQGASTVGTVEQAPANIAQWINASIGQLLMRVGVGIGGLALIWIGTSEIVDALKGGSETVSSGGGRRKSSKERSPKQKKETAKKEPAKKEAKEKQAKEPGKEAAKKEAKEATPKKAASKPAPSAAKTGGSGEAASGASAGGGAELAAAAV